MKMRGLDENSASVFICRVSYCFDLSRKTSRRRRQGGILVSCWCFLNRFLLTQRSGSTCCSLQKSELQARLLTVSHIQRSWPLLRAGGLDQLVNITYTRGFICAGSCGTGTYFIASGTSFVTVKYMFCIFKCRLSRPFTSLVCQLCRHFNFAFKKRWRERSCHTVKPEA